jgi:nicotinate-nucleotide adenylyltransferase
VGHLAVVRGILERGLAPRVLVVPCLHHVLGKTLASFDQRLEMCRLMCGEAGPGASVSDIERRHGLGGYTVDMLEALSRELPGQSLGFVVGADILAERDEWRSFERVEELAPLIVVARAGYDDTGRAALPAPPGVSSSRVRDVLGRGGDIRGLVPESVRDYVISNEIYG